MNFSGFKKQFEDKKTAIMAHPNGHSITVFKDKLSAIQRKQLDKLPLHMAAGGLDSPDDAPQVDDVAPSVAVADQPQSQDPQELSHNPAFEQNEAKLQAQQPAAPDLPEADKNLPDAGKPVGSANRSPAVDNAHATNPGIPTGSGDVDVQKAYQMGQEGLKAQMQFQKDLSANELQVQNDKIQSAKALQATADDNLETIQGHVDDFQKYIQANPIDPKHYIENMGAGSKVSTAIGLLLGGIGGGIDKTGVNPAADFLNKQIERDIAGQKDRMDQQKTVLGANQSLYGDQVAANSAARINMNQIYEDRIKQEALKLGTPQAIAAYKQASADYALKNAKEVNGMATRLSIMNGIKNGGQGLSPLSLANENVKLIPVEQATKEQASIDSQNQKIAQAKQIFAKMSAETTIGNSWNPLSNDRLKAYAAQLAPLIQSEEPSKRYSQEAAENLIKPFITKTFSTHDNDLGKLNGVMNLIQTASAGDTPFTRKYIPGALPNYSITPGANGGPPSSGNPAAQGAPSYKIGDVLKDPKTGFSYQITNANGAKKRVK